MTDRLKIQKKCQVQAFVFLVNLRHCPFFYTRFGLEEGVKLRVAYCKRKSDGRYIVDCSAPVEMRQYDDLKEEYEKNAQATLREAEKIIRKEPEHWLMLHPVWEK